jgi:4-amino-4-deoxy-L-arabinose transferase-like glycosyltransferase
MPTWIVLTALAHVAYPILLAGHLVNHLLQLLLPVVVYGLGRKAGGRVVGFGAGALVAANPMLVAASRRFGVDPAVTFGVPLLVLVCLWGALSTKRSVLAGGVAAAVGATHFTTLGFPVAGLLGMGLFARRGKRALVLVGYGVGLGLTWALLFSVFPWAGFRGLLLAVPEGITPGEFSLQGNPTAVWAPALEIMRSGASTAVEDAVSGMARLLRPDWLPWGASVAFLWLGVPGLALKSQREDLSGWRRWRGESCWKSGLLLLVCLAPLPLFAAADAEPRYSHNLLPVAALLMMRGCVSAASLVERLFLGRGPFVHWPGGLLALVCGGGLALGYIQGSGVSRNQQPAPLFGVVAMEIGEAVGGHFPGPGGLVCDLREVEAYTARRTCPGTVCPPVANPGAFAFCLSILRAECDGDGPIPYVALDRGPMDERTEAKTAFDAWIVAQFGEVQRVRIGPFDARLVEIPRSP